MKTIVTGGAGFIGSHLSRQLLEQGHQVCVIDNLSGGRIETIEDLMQQPDFEFIEADITDKNKLAPYFEQVEWVFHLAGLADIVPSIEQPDRYYATNVTGTLNVLECAKQASVKRFIYAASSSCYGVPDVFPTPETAPIQPQYPYALTKNLGEQLVMHWNQVYRLPSVSLRLFNVYGPHARTTGAYGAVFGVFLSQKIHGKPFTVVGDGKQTRDFTFVTDVARAFINAAESSANGEIMNVGSGDTYSINELVTLLEGDIEYIPKRPGEPDCTYADTRKIQKILNWKSEVNFEEGVKIMINHIDSWQQAPVWTAESIADATATWFRYLKLC